MSKTPFPALFAVTAAFTVSLTASVSGCEPDENRCDPSLCHPPERVVGTPPNCRCEDVSGEEGGEKKTYAMSASVDLDLPSGWTLDDVQLSPQSVGISTLASGVGPVGMKVGGADFDETGLGEWTLTGGIVATSAMIEGADPVAVIRWDAPIVIEATQSDGQTYQQTFQAPKSAIDLTTTAVSGGVQLSGSKTIGPLTVSITGTVLEN